MESQMVIRHDDSGHGQFRDISFFAAAGYKDRVQAIQRRIGPGQKPLGGIKKL